MIRIALSGAQSTGKSTLLDELNKADDISNSFSFKRNIVRDIKDKGYKINEDGDDNTQLKVLSKMMDIYTSPDSFITDRGFLDCTVYTAYLYINKKVRIQTLEIAENLLSNLKYDILYYLPLEFEMVKDGVRSENNKFREDIAGLFEEYISSFNIKTIRLTGTVEERKNCFVEGLNLFKNWNTAFNYEQEIRL